MCKGQKFIFVVVEVSLKRFVDSKFQGRNVTQIGMMVLAEPSKESSFDLIHGRSLFFNVNISVSEMSQDWLFQGPQSERRGYGNPESKLDTAIGRSVGKMVFEIIHRPIQMEISGLKNTIAFTCLDVNGAVVSFAGNGNEGR